MNVFFATVVYPAKAEPNQYGKFNALFVPKGEKPKNKDVQFRISAQADDTRKVARLQALTKGGTVMVVEGGTYEGKPWYDFADLGPHLKEALTGKKTQHDPVDDLADLMIRCVLAVETKLAHAGSEMPAASVQDMATSIFISITRGY